MVLFKYAKNHKITINKNTMKSLYYDHNKSELKFNVNVITSKKTKMYLLLHSE